MVQLDDQPPVYVAVQELDTNITPLVNAVSKLKQGEYTRTNQGGEQDRGRRSSTDPPCRLPTSMMIVIFIDNMR
jgi:hypothetical protein